MLGFVSALSSAVAVMILIMTTLLINLGVVMIKKEEEAKYIRIDKFTDTSSSYRKQMNDSIFSGLSLSLDDLKIIKDANPESIVVYCQYGKNLSKEVATKISTFNYIRLNMILRNSEITLLPPILTDTAINTCFVEKK
nr:hypothetical protein [Vibrio parahaemolyticus]